MNTMDVSEKLVELLTEFYGCDPMYYGVDALAIAQHLISNGVTVQEWISVKDRLPEEKGEYLVAYHPCYWDDVKEYVTYTGIDTFRGKTTWAKKKFQRITHWMPLPQPPKGE